MSIVKKIAATVVLVLGIGAGSAEAEPLDIMTFDSAALKTYCPYVEGALRFDGYDFIYCESLPAWYGPGKVALGHWSPGTATLTRVDGNPFNFISMDFDEANDSIPPKDQTFTGHKVGGSTVIEVFTTDGVHPTMETFSPTEDFTGLTSLDITIRFCRFDNITAQVPEPCTLTLLATGAFGLLAYGWRRRRR